jgi:hypothetical protein
MLRDQMISLLQTAVIFLLLTNLASLAAAVYAVRSSARAGARRPSSAVERNLQAILRRAR